MIDYFKALINVTNNKRLQELADEGIFSTVIHKTDPDTGEPQKEDVYLYENIHLKNTSKGILIQGSLHKYRSIIKGIATAKQIKKQNGFNGDLFTLKDINETLQTLCEVIGFAPSLAVLQNIEIGVNCEVSFDPQEFLKGMLFHKGNHNFKIDHDGGYIQFDYNQYYIKIYDKSNHYGLPSYILRTEIKIMKMQKLHNAGVNLVTLEDINEFTLLQAFELLYNEFEAITYYDYTLRLEELTSKQQDKAKDYQNKEYWKKLSKNKDRKIKQRNREELDLMIQEFSSNLKGQIQRQMIEAKNKILDTSENENMLQSNHPLNGGQKGTTILPANHELTDFKVQNYQRFPASEMLKNVPTDHEAKNSKMSQNYTYNIGANCDIPPFLDLLFPTVKTDPSTSTKSTPSTPRPRTRKKPTSEVMNEPRNEGRFCPITGVSLELENPETKYITTKTLKHLKETDPSRYVLICSMNLPHTGKRAKYETDIDAHIAKQIRNYYRYRHNVKGKEWAKQLTFDFDTPSAVNE
ncbi:hypothetical protein [Capnocytophaga sp. G2]|uniref:hypothetical protein n=1 Tax=Capnocytophaga sp. G2 TaxID=3110695 RepID=UPI002B48455C|nr:hypothetical protein [Capnocytophaga sp. G2]MEB3005598.1 hypothetical protein [Capnocytophaga sp. G2]